MRQEKKSKRYRMAGLAVLCSLVWANGTAAVSAGETDLDQEYVFPQSDVEYLT